MRGSVPITRYSSVCNVLRQWNISLIPTYRVYRLYDTDSMIYLSISQFFSLLFLILIFVCEHFFSYSSMLRTVAAVWVFAKGKGTMQSCRIQQVTDLLHIESTLVTK